MGQDILTEFGVTVTGADSELNRRLKEKLRAEVEAFEAERRERQQLHDKGMEAVHRQRDHYQESRYRQTADRMTSDDLSDQAMAEASRILNTITDEELGKLFGPKSNATYAGKFSIKNRLAYGALRDIARQKGLIK